MAKRRRLAVCLHGGAPGPGGATAQRLLPGAVAEGTAIGLLPPTRALGAGAPGQWFANDAGYLGYYDGGKHAVYFRPPGADFDPQAVTMPEVDCLVRLQQVEWVRLLGLAFTCTTTGDDYHRQAVQQGLGAMNSQQGTRYCGEAVHLRDTRNCAIEQGTFDQVGGNAVYLERHNLRAAVRRNRIVGCGFNGVVLAGDRVFHPLFCAVTDNEIAEVGRIVNYVAGVFLGLSDGCLVAHNYLHDLPHHAVNLGSNGMGRNYVEGNDIRGNLIVDVAGCLIDNGRVVADPSTRGIYSDDYTSNCLVWGNVIIRAGWAFQIHGGKHNVIENNILLDCRTALTAGVDWPREGTNRRGRPGLRLLRQLWGVGPAAGGSGRTRRHGPGQRPAGDRRGCHGDWGPWGNANQGEEQLGEQTHRARYGSAATPFG